MGMHGLDDPQHCVRIRMKHNFCQFFMNINSSQMYSEIMIDNHKNISIDIVWNAKVLHTIEHGYGTCEKSHIFKLLHNI